MMIRGQAVNQGPLPRNMHSVCAQMKHMHITCTLCIAQYYAHCVRMKRTRLDLTRIACSQTHCALARITFAIYYRGGEIQFLNHMSDDHVTYKGNLINLSLYYKAKTTYHV